MSELLVPGCELFAYVVELLGHQALARWDSGRSWPGAVRWRSCRHCGVRRVGEGAWVRVVRARPGHATTVVVECGLATALGTSAAIGVADQFVLVTDRSLCVSVCLC